MSPPVVHVNTFVREKRNIKLDLVSKIFISTELLCGINRLPIFGNVKPFSLTLSFIFSLPINLIIIYFTCYKLANGFVEYLEILKLSQYCICAILAIALRKRLTGFYSELDIFDKETNFGKDVFKDIIKNVVQTSSTVCFIIFLFIILHIYDIFEQYTVDVIIILLVHIAELHFFGHLLSLLIARLRFIGHLMKLSFGGTEISTIEKDLVRINTNKPDMRNIMDYYHRIIVAFDTLNDAIKWQMLIILVTSFISSLSLSYTITLQLIRNEYVVTNVLVNLTLALTEMLPMFAPCRVVDAVHGEARRLVELLSSRLYENKIEKSSRAVAQALLALMEARDLSLSLLRVFDIDISFPFKFLGLLVTYLIILLQFEKVINLDRLTT